MTSKMKIEEKKQKKLVLVILRFYPNRNFIVKDDEHKEAVINANNYN